MAESHLNAPHHYHHLHGQQIPLLAATRIEQSLTILCLPELYLSEVSLRHHFLEPGPQKSLNEDQDYWREALLLLDDVLILCCFLVFQVLPYSQSLHFSNLRGPLDVHWAYDSENLQHLMLFRCQLVKPILVLSAEIILHPNLRRSQSEVPL